MYKRKKIIRINSLTKLLLVIVLLFFLIVFILEGLLKPTLKTLAETQAQWTATEAIHQAILEEIASDIKYTDLVIPHKDRDDRVVFMQANLIVVNRLASESVLKVQKHLEEMRTENFYIPLGQITGIKLLANLGPKIKFKLLPVGTVRVQISDDFSQAGINQTRHKIYLNVSSDMRIAFPLIATETNVEARVPIADSIIVGPVPDTYMFLDIGAQAKLSELTEL
ncbi:sporulation protein YunB [Desulfitibacter alkalitolerans]|uniref:sporulation protein YunB n=1 Tax=Desulfitibacter alkalitolerans TaxID=264641 RepID=UPI000489A0A2|nr:sporulation protein YunB [Desulfitibacter alkalitolerans]